jgi:hypothetical protein
LTIEISISGSGKYVRVLATMPISRELAQQMTKDAIKAFNAAEPRPNGFLFDFRAAPSLESAAQTYAFAYQDAEKLRVDRRARAAIVVAPGDTSHDFSETVLRNAGYPALIFTDEEAAIRWLEE